MKLTVKNLKGEKFGIEAEVSQTVAQVKTVIESARKDLPAANMKLIHSGKVLKDPDTLEKYNIKENDFLVVMVTKPKKPAAAAPAPAVAAAPADAAPVAAPAAASAATPAPAATASESTTTTTTTPPPAAAPDAAPPAPARSDEFPPEVIANLKGMGFPEPEVRACLRAANGNPDVAVEFLTNGIPDVAAAATASAATTDSGAGSSAGSGGGLQALRNHPQFNHLRRLVQSNPQMLQTVLAQIGQQQPELLNEINQNQAAFLEMMNEPVDESAPAPAPSSSATSGGSGGGAGLGGPAGMMGDPAQMAQMMQNMSPQQLQAMAQMMGLTPEQVQAVGHMIGQMPPEQLQEYMTQAMGGGGGMGGGMGGRQVLQLSEEDMAAVNRLTDMGFDRTEAVQAYMACEKNEALAANLLMDSAGQEGGAFGFGGGGSGGSGSGSGGGSNSGSGGGNDDMDDMYD